MSVLKLSEGLYEVRWREEGRQKTKGFTAAMTCAEGPTEKAVDCETKTGIST